ncbi:TPA: replication protein [Serratia marcescens]
MANTAKVINFPIPISGEREKKVADLEEGYTRIANDLFESIMSANFTARQIKLLMAVIRKTYGFNKKFDWISGEQLSEMTGMPRTRCSTTKTELIDMNVLATEGRKFGINKNIHEWINDKPARRREYGATKHKAGYIYVFAESQEGPVKIGFTTRDAEERLKEVRKYFADGNPKVFFVSEFNIHAGAIEPVIHERLTSKIIRGEMFSITVFEAVEHIQHVVNTFTAGVTESVTPLVNRDLQQGVHTKDTITKEKKDNINKPPIPPKKSSQKFDPMTAELPEWLPAETWSSWVTYRKEIGKSIKSMQSVTMAINVLLKSREKGYSPEEIINQSIASGWQGIFEPKVAKNHQPVRPNQRAIPENFATKDYGQTDIPSWAME